MMHGNSNIKYVHMLSETFLFREITSHVWEEVLFVDPKRMESPMTPM